MGFTAYVDGSESRQDIDAGTYILGAALLGHSSLNSAREHMSALKPRSHKKLHWHDASSHRQRQSMVNNICSLPVSYVAVIRTGDVSAKPERRRRMCLERLCFELVALGVSEVILESRGPADKNDRALIDALRSKRLIAATLRIEHRTGPSEPLLWISDILCGALTQDRIGNPGVFDPLRSHTRIHQI